MIDRGRGLFFVALPLLVAGCPLILSKPDLSNVDAGTDDSGGPIVPGDAPSVVSLQGRRGLDYLRLQIEIEDKERDLVGGTIELSSTDGDEVTLRIPDDVSNWQADGVSLLDVPMPFLDCEEDYEVTWTAYVVDAAGHKGPPQATTVAVRGLGTFPEMGLYAYDVGSITGTVAGCVEFDWDPTLGLPLLQLQNDREWANFRVPATGLYTITVGWPSTMDADVYLFGGPTLQTVAFSTTPGDSWEILVEQLQGGANYQICPAFFQFNMAPPPYIATILWQQE